MAARNPFKSRNLRTIQLWGAEAALASSLVRLLFGLQGMLKLLHVDEAPSNLLKEHGPAPIEVRRTIPEP